jgi:hypothetical protein
MVLQCHTPEIIEFGLKTNRLKKLDYDFMCNSIHIRVIGNAFYLIKMYLLRGKRLLKIKT